MNPFDLDDKVIAAIIGAVGTMIGALIQLRLSWRKEVLERARGAPVTKKSRRGPVLAVVVLLLAAGVGGFALSQYWMAQTYRDAAALRGELQTRVAEISATADRIERAQLDNRSVLAIAARPAAGEPRGGEASAATTLGPCRVRTAFDADRACTDEDAMRATVCVAGVPASAVVTEVSLYARPEDASLPWVEAKGAGEDIGRARFGDRLERAETAESKQICVGFAAWDSERAVSARVVVKYGPPPAIHEASHAAAARPAERRE